MSVTPERDEDAPSTEGTRLRGRRRGFETVWTLDRFADVIRDEVARGIERAWSAERIRAWIVTNYELDARSKPHARRAIDCVLNTLRLERTDDPASRRAFRSVREPERPRSQHQ